MGCPLQESAHGDNRIVAASGYGGTVVLNSFFIIQMICLSLKYPLEHRDFWAR